MERGCELVIFFFSTWDQQILRSHNIIIIMLILRDSLKFEFLEPAFLCLTIPSKNLLSQTVEVNIKPVSYI